MNDNGKSLYSIQEKETNLLDMLWTILYAWRMILVCGVLFAGLLSGLKYVKDSQSNTEMGNVSAESLRMSLTDDEIRLLDRTIIENEAIERQFKNNTEYQKNSILMNIDPYNKNQVALQYYVDSGYAFDLSKEVKQDYTKGLMSSYIAHISSGKITEECAANMNLEDNRYLEELITTEPDMESQQAIVSNSVFTVFVTGKDMEQARMIADVVKEKLKEYQGELASKIGAHDLVLISDHEQIVQDTALGEQQAKIEATNYNLRLQQDNLKSKLSAQQLQILNLGQAEEIETDASVAKTEFSLKYLLLGFIIGSFLACFVVALMYIFDARLRNEKELQEFYGLRIFGILDRTPSSKKLFSFVDRCLDSLSGRKRGVLEEELEIAMTNLMVTCKKSGLDKLFFTTELHLDESEQKLVNQIVARMKKEGFEVVFEVNMMQNTMALMQMSKIGKVVLVEKAKQTKYHELEHELILCKEQDADVIGVVVIR